MNYPSGNKDLDMHVFYWQKERERERVDSRTIWSKTTTFATQTAGRGWEKLSGVCGLGRWDHLRPIEAA